MYMDDTFKVLQFYFHPNHLHSLQYLSTNLTIKILHSYLITMRQCQQILNHSNQQILNHSIFKTKKKHSKIMHKQTRVKLAIASPSRHFRKRQRLGKKNAKTKTNRYAKKKIKNMLW